MGKRTKFSLFYYLMILAMIVLLESTFFSGYSVQEISYKKFRDLLQADKIESVVLEQDKIYGTLKPEGSSGAKSSAPPVPKRKHTPWRLKLQQLEEEKEEELKLQFTVIPLKDDKLIEDLQSHGVDYRGKLESHWLSNVFFDWIIPFLLFIFIWGFIVKKMGKGTSVLNIGKSKAKIYAEDPKNMVTFEEVAGIDEAVEEIKEVVSFLKDPGKYTRLGAKLPKGVLLVGPPGTGKTLLARAVAGESGVPFFNMSGSDFVEMFVGVGAARVRDLFAEAKTHAPCIVFIDELDAVGRSRGGGVYLGGGYDERENTLNQLLTEMDGFDPRIGIVIIGATNRPEVLDPALLRPGRFDRQILVDRPDLNGRVQIFKVHTRDLQLGSDVDLRKIAAQTPGFAGADIANVCNEAALLATRRNQDTVQMSDFQDAIERIIAGLEKKNKLINPHEREIVAYHESGHAIVGHFTHGADPIHKVSIVPRGIGALGYTLQTPLEDRYLMSRTELLGKVKGLLGGRAAEETAFGEISTGASNDLEKVSRIVRDMIVIYGMSTRLPNLSLSEQEQPGFLGQQMRTSRHSEKIEQIIDEEVLAIIQNCYGEVKQLLEKNRDKLDRMAHALLERETLQEEDILSMLGTRA
jgi:cell division protease FtsH